MAAQVFLFVLVGATVNIGYLGKVGFRAVAVLAIVLTAPLGAFAIDFLYRKLLSKKLQEKETRF